MIGRTWSWALAGVLLAIGIGVYAIFGRDVWPGRCWLPTSLGYQTLDFLRGDTAQAYCVRVPSGQSLASVSIGEHDGVFAYATAPSELLPAMDRTLLPVESFQWYLVSGTSWSAKRLTGADGRPMILSPDGSAAIVTVDPYGLTGQHWIISTQDSSRICEFTLTISEGVQGCERVELANGDRWDVASLYEIVP